MIQLQLTSEDERTCTVSFGDCESMGEPDLPIFSDQAMRFPWDSVPNEYGHSPDGLNISPNDFKFKAEMFGFKVEVI